MRFDILSMVDVGNPSKYRRLLCEQLVKVCSALYESSFEKPSTSCMNSDVEHQCPVRVLLLHHHKLSR